MKAGRPVAGTVYVLYMAGEMGVCNPSEGTASFRVLSAVKTGVAVSRFILVSKISTVYVPKVPPGRETGFQVKVGVVDTFALLGLINTGTVGGLAV